MTGLRKLLTLIYRYLTILILLLICSGCGVIRRTAVKQVSEAFSGEVAMAVISSDNDPDLIWDAMPFTLKRILISDFAISIYSSMIYYFLKSKT